MRKIVFSRADMFLLQLIMNVAIIHLICCLIQLISIFLLIYSQPNHHKCQNIGIYAISLPCFQEASADQKIRILSLLSTLNLTLLKSEQF